jgi:uncharacterized membrane-anchored protein
MKNTSLFVSTLFACLIAGSMARAQKAESDAPPTEAEIKKAQQEMLDEIEKFGWSREGKGQLGNKAVVEIPKGYRFTKATGTQKMLQMYDNIPSNRELGMLTTEGLGPWIIFEFDETGYVKDDDKDELDADSLLKTLREGQEAGNVRRREMGIEELELLGWAVPPRYNSLTHNLEWATRVRSKNGGGESINYNTRLLGRKGVMEVALVCGPDELDRLIPEYQSIMSGYQYTEGESYAEYREGDKVAQYGLAALVAGGAAVAAGKMGLFAKLSGLIAKLGKGIIVVVIALGATIKKLYEKLTGKRPEQ